MHSHYSTHSTHSIHTCFNCRQTFPFSAKKDRIPQFVCKHRMPLCLFCWEEWEENCPICDDEIHGSVFLDTLDELVLILLIFLSCGLIYLVCSKARSCKKSLIHKYFKHMDHFLPPKHLSKTQCPYNYCCCS